MRVTIVDYGLSNLLSVRRAVEKLGHRAEMAKTAADVHVASVLILPGVGAFADGMQGLAARGMLTPLQDSAARGVPLLGICLGMQMLFDMSTEFGAHPGLGLLPGRVAPIPAARVDGGRLRVPHIGWQALLPPEGEAALGGVLAGCVSPQDEAYFVHSYAARPENPRHVLATCRYGGHLLCAAAGSGNVLGTQFHPEKSGPVGLAILRAFLERAQV